MKEIEEISDTSEEEEGPDYTSRLADELAELLLSKFAKAISYALQNSWRKGREKRCNYCARWAHPEHSTCCMMCDKGKCFTDAKGNFRDHTMNAPKGKLRL